ncbi:MAG: PAS domain-containing protein [Candidatus Pacebacteria bacterium]|nr:PAS domain-containing protein [Candidatus Paceibacterota bacterium]
MKLHNSYNDKHGANNKAALFILSGHKSNLGEVLCINNEVTEALGYEKNELIGRNISLIMPPSIGHKHTEIVLKYFSTARRIKASDVMVLPLHKQGYILVCSLIHRVLPNLQQGVQIIGFLRKISDFSEQFPAIDKNISPEDVAVLLTDDSLMLQAFNIKACRLFGVNPAQANLRKYVNAEEKINMKELIPQLIDEPFMTRVKVECQAEVWLNMGVIKNHVDVEMETMVQTQDDESLPHTPKVATDNDRMNRTCDRLDCRSANDGLIKGALSLLDLQYGKYGSANAEVSLKLIAIVVDHTTEKFTKTNDADNTFKCFKK